MNKVVLDSGMLRWWCPGCQALHLVNVDKGRTPCWDWNNDTTKPTISPSVKVQGGERNITCHCFIRDGVIDFLGDSTHAMRGRSCDMPDLPNQ